MFRFGGLCFQIRQLHHIPFIDPQTFLDRGKGIVYGFRQRDGVTDDEFGLQASIKFEIFLR